VENFVTVIFAATFQSMATSIKEALRRWEEKYGMSASEATEVQLCFQWPPIEKMDNSLAALVKCE
jgi:dynein light chain 1